MRGASVWAAVITIVGAPWNTGLQYLIDSLFARSDDTLHVRSSKATRLTSALPIFHKS